MNFTNLKKLIVDGVELKTLSVNGVLAWQEDRLPSIYQEVEYLQGEANTATYIDLGFAFDTKARFYITLMFGDLSAIAYPFGATENGGVLRCCITAPYGTMFALYGSTGTQFIIQQIQINENLATDKIFQYECTLEGGKIVASNLTTGATVQDTTQASYTMANNMYLFGQNYDGTPRYGGMRKIYSFQYYDKNDELICDLVPCYRKSDGVCGMYDLARKIFLTNVGNGADFTKGADV